MSRKKERRYGSLETCIRIKDAVGRVATEYTIRNDEVEIVNYWPHGGIHQHGTMELGAFLNGLIEHRTKREALHA